MRKAKLVVTFSHAPAYPVRIASGALNQLGAVIRETPVGAGAPQRAFLLVDAAADEAVVAAAKASLVAVGFKAPTVKICPDDALETAGELWSAMAQAGLDSSNVVVALGDTPLLQLAGFVSTAFGGGLPVAYVPTTLAAAACMSVSDQAVLNVPGTNNQVRAELRPLYSCIDLDCFGSLSADQWAQGFGLFAQAAFLDSDEFFFWLSDNATALRNRDQEAICEALVRTLSFRSTLSAAFEEGNAQALDCLSYGAETGEAMGLSLADGMRFSALLSQFKGLISEDVVQAQDGLLTRLGLLQQPCCSCMPTVLHGLPRDAHKGLSLMLPRDIGVCTRELVPSDEVASCLEVF